MAKTPNSIGLKNREGERRFNKKLPCESPRHLNKTEKLISKKNRSGSERGEWELKKDLRPVNLPDILMNNQEALLLFSGSERGERELYNISTLWISPTSWTIKHKLNKHKSKKTNEGRTTTHTSHLSLWTKNERHYITVRPNYSKTPKNMKMAKSSKCRKV